MTTQPQREEVQPEPEAGQAQATRRGVLASAGLAGIGIAGIAALSACSSASSSSAAGSALPASGGASTSGTSASTGAASTGSTSTGSAGASGKNILAATTDIPVGGGKIFSGPRIVVTQPEAGQFKAFSAVCTHMQCIVDQVANGTIDCPCHGSEFSVKDGSVVQGPATKALPTESISVTGNEIILE